MWQIIRLPPAWRRFLIAWVIFFPALVAIADGSISRAQTHRIEEPCGIALIGASLPRRVAAWEQTQGAVVENTQGFTLIELSIVLVIIGLIVGGILVGQTLIRQAETRAAVSEYQQFMTAVNTFYAKYNALAGDMLPSQAAQFGFTVGTNCDGSQAGFRNGDGLLQGFILTAPLYEGVGEVEQFWSDLSSSGLIKAQIPGGTAPQLNCGNSITAGADGASISTIGQFVPASKIGHGNYWYVYTDGASNWFGLSALTGLGNNEASGTTIPVWQASNIDQKIDDGNPTTGNVRAKYITQSVTVISNAPNGNPSTASTCYNSSTNTYSTNVGNGESPSCALSFQFQGAGR